MDETRPLEEADEGSAATVAGQAFGRYVLVRRIGAGGCGEVFAAYDPVLDRRIALKLLFHGGTASWAREARMLAKVDHPQVVTVHDAGVQDGQGYLATELIDGPALDEWLVEHRATVSPSERLALLLPIADALSEAHARGIVHGDVKPANILIAEAGARITDFGVARAVDHEGSGDGDFAGTPAYMAPEQLAGRPANEASDQYAFCLTLCQALSDGPIAPGATDREGSSETRRPSDGGPLDVVPYEPVLPSGLDRATTAALRRGLDPDPAKRFASMRALVDGLVTLPRRRKRRRRLVAAALGITVGMGAAAYASSTEAQVCTGAPAALAEVWNADRESSMREAIQAVEHPKAESESQRVTAALGDYAASWRDQYTEICEATSVRREQSEATMDTQMLCMARARGRLSAAVDIFTDADLGVLRNATPTVESLIPLEECRSLQRIAGRPKITVPPEKREAVEAIDDLIAHSHVELAAGRFDDSRASAAKALAGAREIEFTPLIAEGAYQVAAAMAQRGDIEHATPRGREALQLALQIGDVEMTLVASSLLAYSASQSGSRVAAEAYETMALGLLDRPEIAPRFRANARVDVATVLYDGGKFEQARAMYQQSLEAMIELRGEDDWRVAHALDNIAMADMSLGHDRAAVAGFERAMEHREASVGASHVNHVLTLLYLGALRIKLGEVDRAATDFERARRITEDKLGPRHAWFAASTDGLASVALERGELDRAESLAAEALALLEDTLGADHPFTANVLKSVGSIEFARGDFAEAEAAFLRRATIMKSAHGVQHPGLGEAYHELATARLSQQQWASSLEALDAAIAIDDAVGIPSVERVDLLSERALARLALGHTAQAVEDASAAAALLEDEDLATRDPLPLFAQGRVVQAQAKHDDARRWFERARQAADSELGQAVMDAALADLEGREADKAELVRRVGDEPDHAIALAVLRD